MLARMASKNQLMLSMSITAAEPTRVRAYPKFKLSPEERREPLAGKVNRPDFHGHLGVCLASQTCRSDRMS